MGMTYYPACNVTFTRQAWTRLAVITLFLLLLPLYGCNKEEQKTAQQKPLEVLTAPVMQRDVPIQHDWIGVLDGYVNATIRAQVTGYLIEQKYQEGDLVHKKQLLFQIDPRPFTAALNRAKADLTQQEANHWNAASNLRRVEPLAKKNAVSQRDLDDAIGQELSTRAAVEAAKAAVEEAQLNLGFTSITSPIDGIAGIAKAQLGDLVGPASVGDLTVVSTLDPIKVYINISEREYLKAAEAGVTMDNLSLELILTDGTVYPHKGHLEILDRQVDPTTGTMKMAAFFPNSDNLLRPGQYGRVRATIRVAKGALLVKQRAVSEVQGQYMIATVGKDNTIKINHVEVGDRIGSDWIITKGLQPDDNVVVEGHQKVRDGMTVDPKPFVEEKDSPQSDNSTTPETTEKR